MPEFWYDITSFLHQVGHGANVEWKNHDASATARTVVRSSRKKLRLLKRCERI